MSISPGLVAFKLAFQLSPILLTRGLAQNIPGGILPIIAITEGPNFVTGLLTGGNIDFDSFFANFQVLPGGTVVNQQVATYPYANQAIAANATIQQPNGVSILMTCPARGKSGYAVKLATIQALASTLNQHNSLGGTYSVLTPGQLYPDCLLTTMRDVSGGQSAQVQTQFQLDFFQPIVALSDANQALNNLMQKIQSGVPLSNSPVSAAGLPVNAVSKLVAIYPPSSVGSGLVPQ